MKIFFALLAYFISIHCFAVTPVSQHTLSTSFINPAGSSCGRAVPTNDPGFCASFKSVAYCHCAVEHGMPGAICNDMNRLLQIMIATYGNLWNVCSPRVQHDAPQQECVDDWNFYTSHCK
jgi:hypothetical protein